MLFSVGANAAHGLRRTNEDKRRAVLTLLHDPEWREWPQRRIAEACGVSAEYVSRVKGKDGASIDRSIDATRTVERNGTVYRQNTASRAFETSRRHEVLNFSHHREVASLPPAEARIAKEYDAAQQRGEVEKAGGDRKSIIPRASGIDCPPTMHLENEATWTPEFKASAKA